METKKFYKYIFIVLVYRNTTDILDFIASVKSKMTNYKIIVVNSYYDEKSEKEFERISSINDCDFLSVENRGYGFGNNNGIDFAIKNYEYDFIIISNPDIVIEKFDELYIENYKDSVLGPEIKTLNGKKQNPMSIREHIINEKIEYLGFKHNLKLLVYIGIVLNKISDMLQSVIHNRNNAYLKVYQLHGSFLLIGVDALKKVGLPYDENMFLFAEESYLAFKLKKRNINSYLCNNVEVLHKEDGSMKFIENQINSYLSKSFIYYYENCKIDKK